MLANRVSAIGAFFDKLGSGDPIAWGIVGFFVLFAGGIALLALKFRRDHRREDEERDRRRGIKRK